jgi:hypothetical protein
LIISILDHMAIITRHVAIMIPELIFIPGVFCVAQAAHVVILILVQDHDLVIIVFFSPFSPILKATSPTNGHTNGAAGDEENGKKKHKKQKKSRHLERIVSHK